MATREFVEELNLTLMCGMMGAYWVPEGPQNVPALPRTAVVGCYRRAARTRERGRLPPGPEHLEAPCPTPAKAVGVEDP